jgi:mRNA-degrading endonuclease toxin of MazEF toxin-antitoxin module
MTPTAARNPVRGEIWWAELPFDPSGKKRPVIIVSPDTRNSHPRSGSVLVVPLSTSIQNQGPSQFVLRSGETGLREDSAAWAGNISAVSREKLIEPIPGHRPISNFQICRLASLVRLAMGCLEAPN